jgi:hypothetical protein
VLLRPAHAGALLGDVVALSAKPGDNPPTDGAVDARVPGEGLRADVPDVVSRREIPR